MLRKVKWTILQFPVAPLVVTLRAADLLLKTWFKQKSVAEIKNIRLIKPVQRFYYSLCNKDEILQMMNFICFVIFLLTESL